MTYDFLIIGGGIAGASAAYELAAHGTVLVLEAKTPPDIMPRDGRRLCSRATTAAQLSDRSMRQCCLLQRATAGFCPNAAVDAARQCDRGARKRRKRDLDALLALSEPGEEVIEMTPDDACAMVPFLKRDRVHRAVFEANVTDIDVATLHLSYLKGAKAHGALVAVKQAVTAMEHTGDLWTVHTSLNSYQAVTVINAAGAWADQIGAMAGARAIGLTPKRRTAILIKPPADANCAILPAVDFAGSDAYLKPEGGMLMASPGDATPVEPHDAWADDMDIAVLADWIERETMIKVDKIEHSWAGLRSFVADEAPVVGFDAIVPRFFWLAGQGGYGIMMAPALAILTAELITTGRPGAVSDAFAQAVSPDRAL